MSKEFIIRSYGKSQLARLYKPDVQPKSAWNKVREWMEINPRLKTILEKMDHRRIFLPCEVEVIVRELGVP